MDEIIERIIKIEEDARELLRKAKIEKEGLGETIEKEVARLKKEVSQKAKAKVETLKSFEDGEAHKKIDEIKERLEEVSKKMENTAAQKSQEWVNDLVNTVIK